MADVRAISRQRATAFLYLQVGHLLAEVDDGEDGADVHGHGLGELLVELDGGGAVEHDAHLRHQAPAQKSVRAGCGNVHQLQRSWVRSQHLLAQ